MRLHDWPQRLAQYLDWATHEPFVWGHHDCCHFAGGAVAAITGENPMVQFHYANELGAQRLIRQAGSLEALVSSALGPPMPPAQAGRGDVVLCDLEAGETVGVCLGDRLVFPSTEGGLAFRDRELARLAWRIL